MLGNKPKDEVIKMGNFKKIISEMRDHYVKHICGRGQKKLDEYTLKEKLPKEAGVYIIYYKNNPIYVGRTNTIYGRIANQHLGKNPQKNNPYTSSSFKKSLVNKYGKEDGITLKNAREWILSNCKFKLVVIPEYDDQILFEALLINIWRKKYNLLNDNKDKDIKTKSLIVLKRG